MVDIGVLFAILVIVIKKGVPWILSDNHKTVNHTLSAPNVGPRKIQRSIRFSSPELNWLQSKAEAYHMPVSMFIRNVVLNKVTTSEFTGDSSNVRHERLAVRLNDREDQLIKTAAMQHNLRIATYLWLKSLGKLDNTSTNRKEF